MPELKKCLGAVSMAEHRDRQREERPAWHLQRHQRPAFAALLGRILLPLQPPSPAGQNG